MRILIVFLALALSVPTALAQTPAERPETRAPAASASFEARETWCQRYAAWYVQHTPATAAPSDVSPTHRFEVEFNSCKLDPQQYERDTLAEIAQADEIEANRVG